MKLGFPEEDDNDDNDDHFDKGVDDLSIPELMPNLDGILRAAAIHGYPSIGGEYTKSTVFSLLNRVMEDLDMENLDELVERFETWDPYYPMYSRTNDGVINGVAVAAAAHTDEGSDGATCDDTKGDTNIHSTDGRSNQS